LDNPLIVYVHVPKTGGSSVNRVLQGFSPHGIAHVENIKLPIDDALPKLDWISGHLPLDAFSRMLAWTRRPICYFASVRSPMDQLYSYLNWYFVVLNRGGDTFDSHSEDEKKTALEVCKTDFQNPYAVLELLFKLKKWFLNIQSHHLIGQSTELGKPSADFIGQRLSRFTFISHETTRHELYNGFGFGLYTGPDVIINAAENYYFDKAVLYDNIVLPFIQEHNAVDILLYDIICSLRFESLPSVKSPVAYVLVTDENFDEGSYLDANPDVADAVKAGVTKSGHQHFIEFGHKEGRRQVFPLK
jgi:hypothetical protein